MGLLKAYHIKEESDVEILCERLGYDSVEDPREIKVGNVLIAFFGDDAINDYGIISEEQFEADRHGGAGLQRPEVGSAAG